jgi:hypothetical protein
MYQNFSSYPYPSPYPYYENDLTEFRVFEGLVGQLFTVRRHLTLPNGQVLPRNTRVFIHRVNFTGAGEEMVTIVFPLATGGNAIIGVAQVSADQLR